MKVKTLLTTALLFGAMVVWSQEFGKYSILFAGGDGSKDNPYLIENPQQLSNLRSENGGVSIDAYFKLTGDIDISSFSAETWGVLGWEPISVFHGHLDGNGYAITGLWINLSDPQLHQSSSKYDNAGLIGVLDGTVESLNIETDDSKGGIVGCVNAGAIAGQLTGLVANCSVKGQVYGVSNMGSVVGGLIGKMSGQGRIENSYVEGKVSHTPTTPFTAGGGYMGGLVGSMGNGNDLSRGEDFFDSELKTTITGCYVKADISSMDAWTGGLVGQLGYGDISNCYISGNITGTGSSMIGGLAGNVTSLATVSNCYVSGKLGDGKEEYSAPVVAYVGMPFNSYTTSLTISNCYYRKDTDGLNSSLTGTRYDDTEWKKELSSLVPVNENVVDGEYIGEAKALTTIEMQTRSSFAGFDFEKVWEIDEGEGFPYLRSIAGGQPQSPAAIAPVKVAALQVYATDGVLYVSGLTAGATLSIYDIAGKLIYSAKASSATQSIPFTGKGVYIVKSGDSSVKIKL